MCDMYNYGEDDRHREFDRSARHSGRYKLSHDHKCVGCSGKYECLKVDCDFKKREKCPNCLLEEKGQVEVVEIPITKDKG